MPTADRRSGVRQAPRGQGKPGVIVVDGREVPVLVVDESVAGIGVIAVNLPPVAINAVVHFRSKLHQKESRVTSLAQVDLSESFITRIGLEWIN